MPASVQWDGKSTGSVIGTRIFLKMVWLVGLYPAYCLLAPVSLYYALRNKKAAWAITSFRSHLGLPTNLIGLWRHFFSFGASILDKYAFLSKPGNAFPLRMVNEDIILRVTSGGKGALLLGAHLGNWEIAGNLLHDRIQTPVNFAMVDAEKAEFRKAFGAALDRRRISVIPINQDTLDFMIRVLAALRRNEIVCMHGDRMAGGSGKTVGFFNRPVQFPTGPFAIAAAAQAPIIPIFAVKKGLRTYEMKAFEPIVVSTPVGGTKEDGITMALEKYVAVVEKMVKENPYEWFNFYDFWGDGANPSA